MNIHKELDLVFKSEIDTLREVRRSLDESYVTAVRLMYDCLGKVVVIGVGKSGLIAQKIASTMVSTGTSAAFLHAADGMHGDVGVLQERDIAVAISKSGESDEILQLIPYMKKLTIPIVSITANLESRLAKQSDVVLFTPIEREACPLDLAPTSSTTAALVVGDSLAVGLMKMRDFQPEQFAVRHPGGQLGRQLLLTVKDVMRTGDDNPVISVKESIPTMIYEISSKRCGAVSVVDDIGRLIGLVTDYDIRKILETRSDIFSLGIDLIMNRKPVYTYEDTKAIVALDVMRDRPNPFLVLPVIGPANNEVSGMVHIHDLMAKVL